MKITHSPPYYIGIKQRKIDKIELFYFRARFWYETLLPGQQEAEERVVGIATKRTSSGEKVYLYKFPVEIV